MSQEKANALVEQANAMQSAGDKLAAAPLYVEAAELFHGYASFALVAGDTYLAAGKNDEAVAAYHVCLAGHPDHEQAWEGIGKAHLALGQEDLAREAYSHSGVAMPAQGGFLKRWFGIG